jgi:DNA-directed RNA polymerase specialized sigma24 family protein
VVSLRSPLATSVPAARLIALSPVMIRVFDGGMAWESLFSGAEPSSTVASDAFHALDVQQVLGYLDWLPAAERAVLLLRFGGHGRPWSRREIADRCECSLHCVEMVERAALDRLRRLYQRDGLVT